MSAQPPTPPTDPDALAIPPTDAEYDIGEYDRADYDVVLPPRQHTHARVVVDPLSAAHRVRIPAPYDGETP